MAKYGLEDVLRYIREEITEKYGVATYRRAATGLELRKSVEEFLSQSGRDLAGEMEIENAAIDFLAPLRYLLSEWQTVKEDKGEIDRIVSKRGSLQTVAAYAAVLPTVIKAREQTLGRREPLGELEALKWLQSERKKGEPVQWVDVKFSFIVPSDEDLLPAIKPIRAELPGLPLLRKLQKVAIRGTRSCGLRKAMIEIHDRSFSCMAVPVSNGGDDSRLLPRVLSVTPSSKRLIQLAEWAEYITNQCPSLTTGSAPVRRNLDPLDQGYQQAAWLILTGIWPRLAGFGRIMPARAPNSITSQDTLPRLEPNVTLRVFEMETRPEEVAGLYSRLRDKYSLNRKGKRFSEDAEVLAIIALEVREIEGIRMGNRGFYARVLQRWHEHAPTYGRHPGHYENEEAVRKALERIESAYARMVRQYANNTVSPYSDLPGSKQEYAAALFK